MQKKEDKIILGIDPGTRILGFGLISISGKSVKYLYMGVINLKKESDHFKKLQIISSEVTKIIERFMPDELAVEAPFYGKNPQVMLKLGRAQGAALAAAFSRSVPVYEYAPRKVKIAITGNGAASKEQVAIMLEKTLQTKLETKFLDASDAVSIALCHFYQLTNPLSDLQTSTSWNDFLKAHPEKV